MIVGRHTYGHRGIHLNWEHESSELIIGSFCSIGANCKVYLGGNHRHDYFTTFPFGFTSNECFNYAGLNHPTTKGNVIIENDVWLGENVTIMSGVKIGNGAVIAANSHVVSCVKPYCIYGGNPAKFIKTRFNPNTINTLLKLKWWDKSDEEIQKILPILCSNNIDELIQYYRSST